MDWGSTPSSVPSGCHAVNWSFRTKTWNCPALQHQHSQRVPVMRHHCLSVYLSVYPHATAWAQPNGSSRNVTLRTDTYCCLSVCLSPRHNLLTVALQRLNCRLIRSAAAVLVVQRKTLRTKFVEEIATFWVRKSFLHKITVNRRLFRRVASYRQNRSLDWSHRLSRSARSIKFCFL